MTHLIPTPLRAIRVERDPPGHLRGFHWHGESYEVASVASTWRIDEGWWVLRTWREYALVTTRQGQLVVLYRDLMTNRWYLERRFN